MGRMTWGASDKGETPSHESDPEKKGPARFVVVVVYPASSYFT